MQVTTCREIQTNFSKWHRKRKIPRKSKRTPSNPSFIQCWFTLQTLFNNSHPPIHLIRDNVSLYKLVLNTPRPFTAVPLLYEINSNQTTFQLFLLSNAAGQPGKAMYSSRKMYQVIWLLNSDTSEHTRQ